ncbi:MAG: hypothetical protein DLM61_08420 [Pseudonocardiales bacterium]|nr:MAG: hypothetical protein DLM61_08420 [Pseudonocardiales bacterium]
MLWLRALQRAGAGAARGDHHQPVVAQYRRVELVGDHSGQPHPWFTRAADQPHQHTARRGGVVGHRDLQLELPGLLGSRSQPRMIQRHG